MENTLKQRSIAIELEPAWIQIQIDLNTVEHRFKHHIQRFSRENTPHKHKSNDPFWKRIENKNREQLRTESRTDHPPSSAMMGRSAGQAGGLQCDKQRRYQLP